LKTVLLYDYEHADTVKVIQDIIERNECEVLAFQTDSSWKADTVTSPQQLFRNASHVLFVHSPDPEHEGAFLFYLGYALGRSIRVLVLKTGAEKLIPEHCHYMVTQLSADTFEEFFQTEKTRFFEEDRKRLARSYLIEKGIPCFEENFISVVMAGDSENVELFLKAGFSTSITDVRGNPLLSLAVRSQFPEVVTQLVDAHANVNHVSLDRGYSPLMDAVQKGDEVICRILLEHGADPDLKSKDGQTALVIATGRGDISLCRLLYASGANPDITDNLGMSARKYADLFKNAELTELFNTPRT